MTITSDSYSKKDYNDMGGWHTWLYLYWYLPIRISKRQSDMILHIYDITMILLVRLVVVALAACR